MSAPNPPAGGLFPPTRWTLVLAARERPELRRRALEELVAPRWKALYVVARKRGLTREEAEDAVQSFLARLVEGDAIERLDPAHGRLRAYLRTAFTHHLTNLSAHQRAAKRGAGASRSVLDEAEAQLVSPDLPPDAAFDRAWALALFEDALVALERELDSGERRGPAGLVRALFGFSEAPSYEELARAHGMSVPQLKSFVHRSKARFRRLLIERVSDTLAQPEDGERELAELMKALAS